MQKEPFFIIIVLRGRICNLTMGKLPRPDLVEVVLIVEEEAEGVEPGAEVEVWAVDWHL